MIDLFGFTSLQVMEPSQETVVESILDIATIIFCLTMFTITLYAWSRSGRQFSLLIVASAFLAFLSGELIDLLPVLDLVKTLIQVYS